MRLFLSPFVIAVTLFKYSLQSSLLVLTSYFVGATPVQYNNYIDVMPSHTCLSFHFTGFFDRSEMLFGIFVYVYLLFVWI